MSKPWEVLPNDISAFQSQDARFVKLMNRLLCWAAEECNRPDSDLNLTLKTEAPDGGVDALAKFSSDNTRGGLGYFSVPTVWQFKASPSRNIQPPSGVTGGRSAALRLEVNKSKANELINQGYGYRYCIADDLANLDEWENDLLVAIREINPAAPPPIVLSSERIARWISRLPAVIRSVKPENIPFQDIDSWAYEIENLTKQYVPNTAWESSSTQISNFADFRRVSENPVLIVSGEAGVGKTRFVHNTLSAKKANSAYVVYTTDEKEALTCSSRFSADEECKALIVADECSVDTAVELKKRLSAHGRRLRAIVIHNNLQSERTAIGEIRLSRLQSDQVEEVIRQNYPAITSDRRRAFASLSGGFVRLAIDLCSQHAQIPDASLMDGALLEEFFRNYLVSRLREDELEAVFLISLVSRVGFNKDVAHQLQNLCKLILGDENRSTMIIDIARRLKQSPGFIAIGERYLYVTPRIIAQAAFTKAWDRWIRDDPNRFFANLPTPMEEAFFRQLKDAGSEEMRSACADFFRGRVASITQNDLSDLQKIKGLIRLAEIEPQTIVPPLARLIDSVPADHLKYLHSSGNVTSNRGGWPARREIVWFAERFLALKEHFYDAEMILFKLAQAETETYGNNATGVWKEIFHITLSGTPIPFNDRLQLLERRIRNADERQLPLALSGFENVISGLRGGGGKVLGSPLVAGRIPPPMWRPTTNKEYRECCETTLSLAARLLGIENEAINKPVLSIVLKNIQTIILSGLLREAKVILDAVQLSHEDRAFLIGELDEFINVFAERKGGHIPQDAVKSISAWIEELVPDSISGKIKALVAQDFWKHWHNRDKANAIMHGLAGELIKQPRELESMLDWFFSESARSGVPFGYSLGLVDSQSALVETILERAMGSKYPGFARGYLKGLIEKDKAVVSRVNALLDKHQTKHPRTVFDILSAGIQEVHPFERLISMIDQGLLPVSFLRSYPHIVSEKPLPQELFVEILSRLHSASSAGNLDATHVGLDIAWFQFNDKVAKESRFWERENIAPLIIDLLKQATDDGGREAHAWGDLLREMFKKHSDACIEIAAKGLLTDDHSIYDESIQSLEKFIDKDHEGRVMECIGSSMFDVERGWILSVRVLVKIIKVLSFACLKHWVDAHGADGAKALARHLPSPEIQNGAAYVPEITAYVLDKFGDQDDVFISFSAGRHSDQIYSGDSQHLEEANLARKFLSHPLRRIREWAAGEIRDSERHAEYWRIDDEERFLPA